MSELSLGWDSDQRAAVREFALRACRSLYLAENGGDVTEVLIRMLDVAGLPHSDDEEELALILDLDGPGLWT